MRALIVKRKSGAESGCEPFVNQIDATTTGVVRSITNRTLLDSGRGAGNADDKMAPANSVGNLANERPHHLLRDFEIENRAAADRTMYFDAARLAAEKFLRLVANRNDLAVIAIDRHY